MPTITLTIDHATLDAMARGETVELTATLRARKVKVPAALSFEGAALHHKVGELYAYHRPDMSIARAWKAIKALTDERATIEEALDICLHWTTGLKYEPEWFVKDYPQWVSRITDDLLAQEGWKEQWRKGKALL